MVDKEENLVYNIGTEKKNNSSLCAGALRGWRAAAERKISFRIASAILPEIYLFKKRERKRTEKEKKKKRIVLIIYYILYI